MRLFKSFRSGVVALIAIAGASLMASSALADSGTMSISIIKGGFFIGASAGSGTLTFHGRHYALDIGGLSGGLVIGAAKANLSGTVSHISRASDVAGVYAAVGAGAAGTTGPGRHPAQEREGRAARALRPADRADGQCRSFRHGDFAEIGRRSIGAAAAGHGFRRVAVSADEARSDPWLRRNGPACARRRATAAWCWCALRASEQGPAEVDAVRWAVSARSGEEEWVANDSDPFARVAYGEGELAGWSPLPTQLPRLRSERLAAGDPPPASDAPDEEGGGGI